MKEQVLKIIKNQELEQYQKIISLARTAENSLDVLGLNEGEKHLLEEGIICDLAEGNAPFKPRYNLVNFEKFMEHGSDFLDLKPPQNLAEAINSLLILYKHIPSVTTFPVYLGKIDQLLNPFIDDIEDEEKVLSQIKLFLTHIDRTLTDSFVHANIGPEETIAGRLILQAERELENPIPNLSLKYNKEITSDELALEAVKTGLAVSKPYFANHKMFVKDFGERYGVASCYNGLPLGGGSFTLVRLNLKALAETAESKKDLLAKKLPHAIEIMTGIMDKRIRFIVEESGFFESNFLIKEGLLNLDNYTAMFGVFGLAEAVNYFMNQENSEERYGQGDKADELGLSIMEEIADKVADHKNQFCNGSNQRFLLHAQSGIGSDKGITPGCRIPIGEEPVMHKHILHAGQYHHFFPTGVSDIFAFDSTNKRNPEAVLDIIKGAMESGLRMFAFYTADSELVRITGYLVKRSEMEKLKEGNSVLRDTTALGLETMKNRDLDGRKLRNND
ncbi:glycine radical enzyme, YjjI family [Halobacteroides halobius DSM 5150]|uniref:Glycine radical enzyme, YjjI family n=1 Tax=Halobacteroides halobius (strain ATCC 35273 / DSM 5150 / MD-1) TaxID=748449 RepID=L0K8Z0_HALHC|nr:YjjI family glycine radical enzyme [Halobacteroides halobius]AGB40799.1 glycine radical enzyme, YjjI family [Halobacteroides halobius DSM 5150]